jgi:glycosyltransferase involved in cell wall biosynthesis
LQPVFSIITVTYNAATLLQGTINSVIQQTYPNIEYIIVDGNSSDSTVDIIRKNAAHTPYLRWVSEPDKGLYDAMNKGLKMATGDFVCFLNGGDHLSDPQVLERAAAACRHDTDVLYGETMLVTDDRSPVGTMSELSTRQLPKDLHWRQYLQGMLVVHQSFVPRRTICPPYELGNLCADYDWCIKILKKSRRNTNTNQIWTNYLMGGISKQRHRQSLNDRFKVMRTHFGLPLTLLAHVWIVFRAGLHRLLRAGKPRY